jgi:ADP-heptose:LPS heptosyltransferase
MLAAEPEIDRRWVAPRTVSGTIRLARALRAERFAAVVDLFSNPRSALLVRATGAPVRIGEARRGRRRAYTLARVLTPGKSAIEQHLDALRGLGLAVPPPSRPVLHVHPAERAAGEAAWRRVAERPGVVVHLAASQPAKEWPTEHAVELVRSLRALGITVVLSSAPHRPGPSAAVAAETGTPRLEPLPIRGLLGFLAAAAAVVTVDGMVAHAAVALDRPTVALFGPTDPGVWFPYEGFGPFRVLHAGHDCGGCDRQWCTSRACMRAIAPGAALAAVRALLAGAAAGGEVRRG